MLKAAYIAVFALFLSACTQQKFQFLSPADADAQPKTPGYYNPNNQKYALPQAQKPVIENQFQWKSSHEHKAQKPEP